MKAFGFAMVVAGLSFAVVGCDIPASLVVSNAQATYSCVSSYSFCQYPDSSGGCSSGTIPGTAPTLLCESDPANAGTDCNMAAGALSGQLTSGGLPGPISTPTGTATLIQANSCNPGATSEAVIGEGVNSFAVNVDSTNSTLQVVDTSDGSGATTAAHGTLSYALNGAGGITLNLISLTFGSFVVDGVAVNNLTISGQGPATGTVSGGNFTFPAGSVTVTISGASTAAQVAELSNDVPLTGTLDPATNSFTLSSSGPFLSTDITPGTSFEAAVSLQGTYQQGPPTAVAGGPYNTTGCTADLDASGSTDYKGGMGTLFYQWFEGQALLGAGTDPAQTVTLLSGGTNTITLRVFDSTSGVFSEATTTVTTTDSSCGAQPVANAGAYQTVECSQDNPSGALVTLNGSASSDPDGDKLSYLWTDASGSVGSTASVNNVLAPFTEPGPTTTTYALKVTDPGGLSSTATTNVTVQDTKSPALKLSQTSLTVVLPTASATGVSSSTLDLNQYATATDTCDPSPIVSNTAPATLPIGVTDFLFTAADHTGNTSSPQPFAAQVVYNFSGYLAPVLGTGQSLFRSGRTIPVQFQLTAADGTIVTNAVATIQVGYVSSTTTGTTDMTDATSSGNGDTGNQFRFDSTTDDYIYNLSTSGWATGTWLLRTTLNDGTHYDVYISIE